MRIRPPSNFRQDLSREAQLGRSLDPCYERAFTASDYQIRRVTDRSMQQKGVDLILHRGDRQFFVDEKAQLDYLNKSLPTFAFELSYLKRGAWRTGWLLDPQKQTDIFFLITSIFPTDPSDLSRGLQRVRVTGVYRRQLVNLLKNKGLDDHRLYEIDRDLRQQNLVGHQSISELNARKEGAVYFSKNNKNEQPVNLVLKLDFLIRSGVARDLFTLPA